MKGGRQDDLFNVLLEQAMEDQIQSELEQLPSDEELKAKYHLSENFQKNMARLIAKEEKMDRRAAAQKKKKTFYAAAIAVAACVLCSLMVWQIPPVRGAIQDKVFRFYEDLVQIKEPDSSGDDVVDPMKDPEYIPEGYYEVLRQERETLKKLVYEGENGSIRIFYHNYLDDINGMSLYDKNLDYSKVTLLGILDAYWAYNDQKGTLWWEYNNYTYSIYGVLSEEEAIKIAESILK